MTLSCGLQAEPTVLPPMRVPKCSAQRIHTAQQLKLTVPLAQI